MTKISEKDLQGLLPNLRGLPGIDPRTENRVNEAFRRVYEIMLLRINETRKELETKFQSALENQKKELNSLIGVLSQPLVGSGVSDPVLQSVISSYGPQSPNHFLGGPIPSFRQITLDDLPPISSLPATQLNADGTILDVNAIVDGEYIRRTGNTIVSGVPVGTTVVGDGVLPDAEGQLYITPANHRTKMRHVLLFNNIAGALVANILVKDDSNNIVYTNNFNLASQEKLILTLNLILPESYTFRGYTSIASSIEYTLFAVEEPL